MNGTGRIDGAQRFGALSSAIGLDTLEKSTAAAAAPELIISLLIEWLID